MRAGSRAWLVGLACTACGGLRASPRAAPSGDDLTLYRDVALVRQRAVVEVPAGMSTRRIAVAGGTAVEQLVVLDRGGLAIRALHVPASSDRGAIGAGDGGDDDDAGDVAATERDVEPAGELAVDIVAPRAGRYTIDLAYLTDRLRWDVAYTLTTTPARDRATLAGALAVRNRTGRVFAAATARVIDAELAGWRGKTGEQLASELLGLAASSTRPAAAHELGRVELGAGESRVVVLAGDTPRALTSVLVFDPIGTRLDHPTTAPALDRELGVVPAPATTVAESLLLARDDVAAVGLPAGPVRVFERGRDGALAVLGVARLFDAETRRARFDTIALGIANGVTGRRERRELTQHGHKLVEEFAITIDNARPRAVDVLVREHLYRGQTWALGYYSAPRVTQEGAQQFTLATRVAARSKAEVFYVVVYCDAGNDCEADGADRPVR